MKIFNLIMVIFFLLAALLQYNDPDPLVWISLYLSGAIICYFSIKGKVYYIFSVLIFSVYISYAVFLFFDTNGVLAWIQHHHAESIVQSMKASKPWIEEAREFFGLTILIFALLTNMIVHRYGSGLFFKNNIDKS